MATTFERVQTILTKKFSVPAEIVRPDAPLESLGLDSLDLIEVLFEVEEAFDIRVPQEGGSALKTATVQDIVDSIDKLLAAPKEVNQAAAE
jgi:acyl carrier protein